MILMEVLKTFITNRVSRHKEARRVCKAIKSNYVYELHMKETNQTKQN